MQNPTQVPRRIVVAPLDWGLGHATRMVPVIQQLLHDGHFVLIAADHGPLAFLRREFPQLHWLRIPSYNISYASSGALIARLTLHSPRIFYQIWREHRIMQRIVKEWEIDTIISDNRFGLFHSGVHTVFVSHQISIQVPPTLQKFQKLVFRLNRAFIRRFNELWIPDYEDGLLSGQLSTQYPIKQTKHYIGPLSRFYHTTPLADTELRAEIVVLLSGPEPQRTMLENKLLTQLANSPYSVLLIRGLAKHADDATEQRGPIKIIPFLSGGKLRWVLEQAKHIVCRSGYSTLLDLVAIGKSAIIIPTPGQTEQEYLGNYLMQQGWFYSQTQDELHIAQALDLAKDYKLPQDWPIPERWPLTI